MYAVQPKSAAPPGVRNPATAIVPPNRYSQYANALSRGNDTSGAPICSGTTKFAKANTIGVAKNSSMIVPCMVNSWLYCSGERNCMPGRASSARISSAMKPPSMKNTKDVTMYMIPICFASVVRSIRASAEPLTWLPDRPRPGHDRLRRDGRHGWPPVSRSSHWYARR